MSLIADALKRAQAASQERSRKGAMPFVLFPSLRGRPGQGPRTRAIVRGVITGVLIAASIFLSTFAYLTVKRPSPLKVESPSFSLPLPQPQVATPQQTAGASSPAAAKVDAPPQTSALDPEPLALSPEPTPKKADGPRVAQSEETRDVETRHVASVLPASTPGPVSRQKIETETGMQKNKAQELSAASVSRPLDEAQDRLALQEPPLARVAEPVAPPEGVAEPVAPSEVEGSVEPSPQVNISHSSMEEVNRHFNLGVLHQREGKMVQALEEYREVLRLSPLHVEAHNNLGIIYREMGRYEEAQKELERAMALNPFLASAHHNLGVVFQLQENLPEAVKRYQRALELEPNNAMTYNNLGVVYRDLNQLAAARGVLEKALSLNPSLPQISYNLALVEEADGNREGAVSLYRRFIELSQTLPQDSKEREVVEKVRQYLLYLASAAQPEKAASQ